MEQYISDLEKLKRKLTDEEGRTLHYKRMYEQAQKDYLNTIQDHHITEKNLITAIIIGAISITINIYFLLAI